MTRILTVFAVLIAGAFSFSTQADDAKTPVTSVCAISEPEMSIRVEFEFLRGLWKSPARYELARVSSKLEVNGKAIPALNEYCMTNSYGGKIRCTHNEGDIRAEVYPSFSAETDLAVKAFVIFWNGNSPTLFKLQDCK